MNWKEMSNHTGEASPAKQEVAELEGNACQMCAALLCDDRWLLLGVYWLLVAPTLLITFLQPLSLEQSLGMQLLREVWHYSLLFLLCRRWVARLSKKSNRRIAGPYVMTLLCCAVVWLPLKLIALALSGLVLNAADWRLFSLILLVPAASVAFRYYFAFLPAAAGMSPPRDLLAVAQSYTTSQKLFAIKVLLPSLAFALLFDGMALLPSPDERLVAATVLRNLASGIFWLLTSYLGLAYALVFMQQSAWRQLHLDPYREARLTTLMLLAPRLAGRLLTPKNSLKVLFVGMLLHFANLAALVNSSPAPAAEVEALRINERTVLFDLLLKDNEYHFHGFRPGYLRLAGTEQTPVSGPPVKVRIHEEARPEYLFHLPHENATLKLHLEFDTNRTKAGLKDLKDLYLWYLGKKWILLDMSKAELGEAPLPVEE